MDPLERMTAVGLAAGRLAIGAGLWLAPRRTAGALGFGELDSRELALGRIAASRDLVLGVWQLSALGDPAELRRATAAVAAADGGDALCFALAARAGGQTRATGIRGFAAAFPATIAGVWLFLRLGRRI